MHRWLLTVGMALLLAPAALASTPASPGLTDAEEDTAPDRGPPLATPWSPALDLSAVWFTDDHQGLHAHLRVADLGTLDLAEASAADFMWIAIWSPGYQEGSGAAVRNGTWELRAEYRPLDDPAWHFWLERPCLDGDDSDGCAAADRDIVNGLEGSVDRADSTVTITAPWHHLAHPRPGDGIQGLWATAQADYPGYPVRWVDWDTDEGDQCYEFAQVPTDPGAFNGTDTGPSGSSNGRAALPRPYPSFGTCAEARAQDPPADEAAKAVPRTTDGEEEELSPAQAPVPAEDPPAQTDEKQSPGIGVLLVPGLLGAAGSGRAFRGGWRR